MHWPRLNCFLLEADGRNGISTIRETDNEQNKRSEEKQKTQPLPCVRRGRVRAGVAVLREKWRANFPALAPSSGRRVTPLLPSVPSRLRSHCVPLSLARAPERRERATKGGKVRERNYGRKAQRRRWTRWGWLLVGVKRINTFALKLPRVQGRGIVVFSHLVWRFDLLNSYHWCQDYTHIHLSMNKFANVLERERPCDLSKGNFAKRSPERFMLVENVSLRHHRRKTRLTFWSSSRGELLSFRTFHRKHKNKCIIVPLNRILAPECALYHLWRLNYGTRPHSY